MMDNSSTSPSHEQTSQPQPVASNTGSSRSRPVCDFYSTKKGCRAGNQCRYRHAGPPSSLPAAAVPRSSTGQVSRSLARAVQLDVKQVTSTTEKKDVEQCKQQAIASKPVAPTQIQDPREFQITQVVRRFNPTRKDNADGGTTLALTLIPSDPDFPFELGKGLQCELVVPKGYLQDQSAKPLLHVNNVNMPRGHQINVERGFAGLATTTPTKTLLQLLKEVDKKLETFLTAEKAPTIKIVTNRERAALVPTSQEPSENVEPTTVRPGVSIKEPAVVTPQPLPPVLNLLSYTKEELAAARSKRATEVRQLESRMRTVPGFEKSSLSYNIPLVIPKPERLPVALQAIKEVVLHVPSVYNLEPCTIMLKGVSSEYATSVELGFEKHVKAEPTSTLMAHINWLIHHIHALSTEVNNTAKEKVASTVVTVQPQHSDQPSPPSPELPTTEVGVVDADRPHLHVIPRPPEWDLPDNSESETDNESYSGNESDSDEEEAAAGVAVPSIASNISASNNSILISFPGIELFGIELLELAAISLQLKCDRCKTGVEINNLKASVSDTTTTTTNISCTKCTSTISATFHSSPIHANSIKAGHLDLISCTITDMLPSTFIPTCSDCSTPYPNPPGTISVRGDTTLTICRECHQKLTFKIPDIKFLRVATSLVPTLPLRNRKPKENLGITSGQPLPHHGTCSHYRKSMRWFRFSCCDKVYPCDRCHDELAEPKHGLERANRMICGWCSKEQNYRVEDCGVCRNGLVGRKGGGFWEGGKGTRDKARMSRKDPRKYKRRGGDGGGGAK